MAIPKCYEKFRQTYASEGLSDGQSYEGLDSEEKVAFDSVRASLDALALTPAQREWTTPGTLCRYLRARKWDAPKATKMITDSLEWRQEAQPHAILYDHIKDQSDHLSNVVHGFDALGHPLVYMRNSRDPPGTAAEKMQFILHNLEECCRQIDETSHIFSGVERMTYIVDLRGFSMKNSSRDMAVSKEWLHVLGNHMPERLHRAYLMNYPMAFKIFYNLLKPLMDPVTKAKVNWVAPTTAAERREYFKAEGFDMAWFDSEYGGDLVMPTHCNVVTNTQNYKPFFETVPAEANPLSWAMMAGVVVVLQASVIEAEIQMAAALKRKVLEEKQQALQLILEEDLYTMAEGSVHSYSDDDLEMTVQAKVSYSFQAETPQPAVISREVTLLVRRPTGESIKVSVHEACTARSLINQVMGGASRSTARMVIVSRGKKVPDGELVTSLGSRGALEIAEPGGCCVMM